MLEDQDSNIKTIYVNLLNEGVSVVRPIEARELSPNVFKIIKPNNYNADDEKWEFLPESIVECEEENREGKMLLVAKRTVNIS